MRGYVPVMSDKRCLVSNPVVSFHDRECVSPAGFRVRPPPHSRLRERGWSACAHHLVNVIRQLEGEYRVSGMQVTVTRFGG